MSSMSSSAGDLPPAAPSVPDPPAALAARHYKHQRLRLALQDLPSQATQAFAGLLDWVVALFQTLGNAQQAAPSLPGIVFCSLAAGICT